MFGGIFFGDVTMYFFTQECVTQGYAVCKEIARSCVERFSIEWNPSMRPNVARPQAVQAERAGLERWPETIEQAAKSLCICLPVASQP